MSQTLAQTIIAHSEAVLARHHQFIVAHLAVQLPPYNGPAATRNPVTLYASDFAELVHGLGRPEHHFSLLGYNLDVPLYPLGGLMNITAFLSRDSDLADWGSAMRTWIGAYFPHSVVQGEGDYPHVAYINQHQVAYLRSHIARCIGPAVQSEGMNVQRSTLKQ